jgi:coenzyme F420-reducing hydrogenase alpha subunit
MSKSILFQKATRIEGNANIHVEIEDGRVKAARFLVHEFRGFESIVRGRRVEYVPHMVSRICGLCSTSHQVASIKAVEDALEVQTPFSVQALREIMVLGEWINSHALSYFFLTMPDFVGASKGIFQLMESNPDITRDAFALRDAGLRIVKLLGKRPSHPVTMGIGRFLIPPAADELLEIRRIAEEVKERTFDLICKVENIQLNQKAISFPLDQQINFATYDGRPGKDIFCIYDQTGETIHSFNRTEIDENVSEMRAEWTLAKFPYLTRFGFPAGIMLVGPLSRSFQRGGFLEDPDLDSFELTGRLRDRVSLTLESYDACRLLEIFWAAKRILDLLKKVDLLQMSTEVNYDGSGQGIGVLEAPRGILLHSYLINQGCIERMRLLVATQFNNAFINLLLKDLAEKYVAGEGISEEGERLIGRCVRIFDPCLSCATH